MDEVFRSSFFGRCRLACIEGEEGGSFLTTILGPPPVLRSLSSHGKFESLGQIRRTHTIEVKSSLDLVVSLVVSSSRDQGQSLYDARQEVQQSTVPMEDSFEDLDYDRD